MTSKEIKPGSQKRANPPPILRDEQPLLRALVAQATKRGDTLAMLAKALGVTYERLAQWRRNESAIRNAHASVHEKAAQYLGIPSVLVLVMSGGIGLNSFVWPSTGLFTDRVARELERLRQNPFLGPFVPSELATATPAVQLFVAFLFHELGGEAAQIQQGSRWLTALQLASSGNIEAQLALDALRSKATQDMKLF